VISYWKQDFAGQPLWEIFNIRSGLVFYGGLIGASIGTILCTRRNKLPLWKIADILAPSIALGHAFGRIGCLMTGCCYGRASSLPWAIQFPKEHATGGLPVHPTQLYESALNFLLFLGLSWFHPRKKFDGHVFATYLIAYAILRGVVEIFRPADLCHGVQRYPQGPARMLYCMEISCDGRIARIPEHGNARGGDGHRRAAWCACCGAAARRCAAFSRARRTSS
jgi:prolipoprotein diacylglyceryl transferase